MQWCSFPDWLLASGGNKNLKHNLILMQKKTLLWSYPYFWVNTLSRKCIVPHVRSSKPSFSLQRVCMRLGGTSRVSKSLTLKSRFFSFLLKQEVSQVWKQTSYISIDLKSGLHYLFYCSFLHHQQMLRSEPGFPLPLLSERFLYHPKCPKSSGPELHHYYLPSGYFWKYLRVILHILHKPVN